MKKMLLTVMLVLAGMTTQAQSEIHNLVFGTKECQQTFRNVNYQGQQWDTMVVTYSVNGQQREVKSCRLVKQCKSTHDAFNTIAALRYGLQKTYGVLEENTDTDGWMCYQGGTDPRNDSRSAFSFGIYKNGKVDEVRLDFGPLSSL